MHILVCMHTDCGLWRFHSATRVHQNIPLLLHHPIRHLTRLIHPKSLRTTAESQSASEEKGVAAAAAQVALPGRPE